MKSQRRNNNNKSLSTMGYLTMIVALAPSVAAFSSRVKSSRAAVSVQNSDAFHTGSTWETRRTRLHYTSGASHEHTIHSPTTTSNTKESSSTWWNSIFAREESSAADDYLEFLDKRYNRILHDEDEQPDPSTTSNNNKGFPVLNWLYQGRSNEPAETSAQKKDDALYVLGVANLASKKLLQKHHLLDRQDEQQRQGQATKKDVVDAEIVANTPAAIKPLVAFLHQVSLRRQVLVQRQMQSFRFAVAFLMRSLMTGPVAASRKLFAMGGGKKSVALTLAALAAMSVLLRPFVRVVADEATNTMRP